MTESGEKASRDPIDIRPAVRKGSSGRAPLLFGAILLASAGGLFYALQIRRLAVTSDSALTPTLGAESAIVSPTPLVIPYVAESMVTEAEPSTAGAVPEALPPIPSSPYAQVMDGARARPHWETEMPSRPPYSQEGEPPPGINRAQPLPTFTVDSREGGTTPTEGRVQARPFRNPNTTVPQGAVIQAVMETALDSTRPGFARAIVSRDVMSFDGSRILVPRGSRLFGTYQADVSLGQKRALIQWQRLTRPDGAQIDLDSPSADPLGRAGLKGQVNTHFFQRFSGAILQSVLDIGVRAATRKVDGNTVIVGLPGSNTQASTVQSAAEVKPTLKTRQGASVSVFVARDLDFSSVER